MSLQEKRYPRETIQKVTVASELELSPMGRRATARRQHPLIYEPVVVAADQGGHKPKPW